MNGPMYVYVYMLDYICLWIAKLVLFSSLRPNFVIVNMYVLVCETKTHCLVS